MPGTESLLGTGTASQALSGAIALPSTGGYPVAEALSVMGMVLMAIGRALLKKKLM
jgi:hypothetical protein